MVQKAGQAPVWGVATAYSGLFRVEIQHVVADFSCFWP